MGWRDVICLTALLLQILAASSRSYPAPSITSTFWNSSHGADVSVRMAASLRHIDGPSSPWKSPSHANESVTSAILRRDEARMAVLQARMRHPSLSSKAGMIVSPYDGTELASTDRGALSTGAFGSYYVTLSIGTPRRVHNLLLDSITDLTWMRCKPCVHCADNAFNPALSSTFKWTSCANDYCAHQPSALTSCSSLQLCAFQKDTKGVASVVGHLAEETFYVHETDLNDVIFGCTDDGQHERAQADVSGVLGIGHGGLSVGLQLSMPIFFCIPMHDNQTHAQSLSSDSNELFEVGGVDPGSPSTEPEASGFFGFGRFNPSSLPRDAVTIELAGGSRAFPNGLFLPIVGILVHETPVQFNPKSLVLQRSGEAGVVLDTGITFSRLSSSVYDKLQAAFWQEMLGSGMIRRADPVGGFEDCYTMSDSSYRDFVPTVQFVFASGQNFILPTKNLLMNVDATPSTYCFAFKRSSIRVNILGSFQLAGTLVVIRPKRFTTRLTLAANQCTGL